MAANITFSLWVTEYLTSFAIAVILVLIGFAIERRGPVPPHNFKGPLFNLLYFAPASLLQKMLVPAGAAASTFIIARTTGGLIPLPSTGWFVIPGTLLYVAAMDLGEYAFHRAQHSIPVLWSMHSLHHSDPDLNISTSVRHYWSEYLLKSLTIYPAVGLLFRVSAPIAFTYWIAAFYNFFVHMNLPIGFGDGRSF